MAKDVCTVQIGVMDVPARGSGDELPTAPQKGEEKRKP